MQALPSYSNVPLQVYELGLCEYQSSWERMRDYTETRNGQSADQIWYLQHPPVYTLGLNGKPNHILNINSIPRLSVDRGGQVTYHGPGQLIAYVLIDLRRKQIGVKQLVEALEQAVIDYLRSVQIDAERRPGAPGVYVDGAKIAALGLRVKRGCSYHGLSLNVDMDLSPFADINPCGYPDMPVTQIKDLIQANGPSGVPSIDEVTTKLQLHLCERLGYSVRGTLCEGTPVGMTPGSHQV